MLSPDVELVDLDGRHWANWWTLLWPPGLDRSFAVVLAFVEDGELVRAVQLGKGAVELRWHGTSHKDLAATRAAAGAGVLLMLDTRALPAIFGDFEAKLRSGDDFVAQWTTIWGAIKRAAGRGLVRMDPPLLDVLPAPSAESLQRTFDLLVPDGSALSVYVMEDDGSDIHTSIIASKDGGDIVFATTHMGIADEIGAKYLARDWRKRYGRVVEVIESRFDAPSIAVFLEKGVVERVMTGPVDQLSRELSKKNIVIDPAPLWLSALLGGAAIAGAATRGARSFSKLIPKAARKRMAGLAKQAQDQIKATGFDPWELLGFNPIQIWLDLRKMFLKRS